MTDIIFEGEGNTLDMIKLWKDTGFDEILRQAWEDGEYLEGKIDDTLKFKPLSELLNKNIRKIKL